MERVLNFIDQYMWAVNLFFYLLLSFPILYNFFKGLEKGFKRSIWNLVFKLIFLGVFIFTLELIANSLYNSKLFGLPNRLNVWILHEDSSSVMTFKDFAHLFYEKYSENLSNAAGGMDVNNPYTLALVDMFGVFIFKIVWGILYFTIIKFLWWVVKKILYAILLRDKKEFEGIRKGRLVGSMVGLVSGVLSMFVMMVYITGLMSLVRYTGEIKRIEEGSQTEETQENNNTQQTSEIEVDNYIIKLADEEEPSGSSNYAMQAIEYVQMVSKRLVNFTKCWTDNFYVKTINKINVKLDTGNLDEEGKPVFVTENVLDATFDTLVRMTYVYEETDEEEKTHKLSVRVNLVTELNNVINGVLYLVDDDKVINSEGKLDLSKVNPDRVEIAFSKLSEINLIKVLVTVGIGSAGKQYLGEEATESEIRDLALADYTGDIARLGKAFSGLFELGIGSFIQDMINNPGDMGGIAVKLFNGLTPKKIEGETDLQYDQRVSKIRNKITDAFGDLKLLHNASKVGIRFLANSTLKQYIEELGLNENDANAVTNGQSPKSYIQNLINTVSLSEDIGTIFKMVFDTVDFNGGDEGNIAFLMANYTNLTQALEEDTERTLTMDDISSYMNVLLARLSNLTFVNSLLDIGVKALTIKIQGTDYSQYLTDENIYGDTGINWKEELGTKIPNLVTAIVDADILGLVMGEGVLMDKIWSKAIADAGLQGYLTETINALFDLKLLSNFNDASLRDLLNQYLGAMDMGGLKIIISDKLGTPGHRIKDELLNLIGLADDITKSAHLKGANNFNEVFTNVKYLIYGISGVDAKKIEDSTILGPSIVHFLANSSIEMIKSPYIYEDKAWYSTYNDQGEYVTYGELYNLVQSIKTVAANEDLLQLFDDTSSFDPLNIIKNLSETEINNLFASRTIQLTLSDFATTFDSEQISIKIPSYSEEYILVSNYAKDDEGNPTAEGVTLTSEYLLDEDGNQVLIDENPVKLAQTKVIKKTEMLSLVNALKEVTDISSLTDSSKILDTIKTFDGPSVKNPSISKLDVILESNILRCSISFYLTGEHYDNFLIYPVEVFEEDGDTKYITQTDMSKLFTSIIVLLNETNLENLDSIDFNSFKSLSDASDENLDKIASSSILRATLSDKILTASDAVVIPSSAKELSPKYAWDDATQVLNVDNTYKIITKQEVKALLKAIGFIDFDSMEDSTSIISLVDTFNTNSETILSSEILRCSISHFLTGDHYDNFFTYPYKVNVSGDDYILFEYDIDNAQYYIKKADLQDLFLSIDVLIDETGFSDLNTVDFEMFKQLNSTTDENMNKIVKSSILRATLSDKIKSASTSVIIPTSVKEGIEIIAYNTGTNEVEFDNTYKAINQDEIKYLLKAIGYLDFDSMDSSTAIMDTVKTFNTNSETILRSDILRASVSHFLTGDNYDNYFVYPYKVDNGIVSYELFEYDSGNTQYYLKKADLQELFESISILMDDAGFGDLSTVNFDLFKDLSLISETKMNKLVESKIFDATISNKLNDAFGSSTQKILIPYGATIKSSKLVENASVWEEGDTDFRYIKSTEIKYLIRALYYIDFDMLGNSSNAFDSLSDLNKPSLETGKTKLDVILRSSILNATFSDVIMGMDLDSMSLIVLEDAIDKTEKFTESGVTYLYDESEAHYKKALSSGIISSEEIINLIKALKYIDLSKFTNGDDIFGVLKDLTKTVSLTSDTLKIDAILDSKILYATIANYIIKLDGISIDINVPFNDDVLVSEAGTPLKFNNLLANSSNNVQKEVYLIKDSELRAFILAAGSIDLNKMSTNPDEAIVMLSNKIRIASVQYVIYDLITASKILSTSISNYIVSKSADLGFSSIVFPIDELDETEVLKINVASNGSVTNNNKHSIIIDATELTRFIIALSYLDLSNIASDTLGAIQSLNEVIPGTTTLKINVILNSEIIRYTLSKQIEEAAGTGATPNFIVPKQAFELNGTNIKDYSVYSSFNENTGAIASSTSKLLLESEILSLINALDYLDLNSITANDVISLSYSTLENKLLASKIIHANVSDKFKTSLSSNTHVGTAYNTLMESDELTYDPTNSSAVWVETVTKKEILNVFQALKVMGTNDMDNFEISPEVLFILTDDGNNANDDTQVRNVETRVDFLMSIFIRSYLTTFFTSTDYEGLATDKVGAKNYLKISAITNEQDTHYSQSFDSTPSNSSLTINDTDHRVEWEACTLSGGFIVYYIYIDGRKIDTGSPLTTNYSTDLYTEYMNAGVGDHKIQVVAVGTSMAGITKPYIYTETQKPREYDPTLIAQVSNVSYDESTTTLTFNGVERADYYLIVFTDENSNEIRYTIKEQWSSGLVISRNIKDILVKGHSYSYSIAGYSNSQYILSHAPYNSSDNIRYYADSEPLEVEYNNDELLYFTNLDFSDSTFTYEYLIMINSDDYYYIPGESTSDLYDLIEKHESYFTLDLRDSSLNLDYGSITIEIDASKSLYSGSYNTITINKIDKQPDINYNAETEVLSMTSIDYGTQVEVKITSVSDPDTVLMYKIYTIQSNSIDIDVKKLAKEAEYVVTYTIISNSNYLTDTFEYNLQK